MSLLQVLRMSFWSDTIVTRPCSPPLGRDSHSLRPSSLRTRVQHRDSSASKANSATKLSAMSVPQISPAAR